MVSLETINERLKYLEEHETTENGGTKKTRRNISNKYNNSNQNNYKEYQQEHNKEYNNRGYNIQEYNDVLNQKLKSVKQIFRNANEVDLKECIGPAFYDVHCDIREGLHSYYDLVGGRGSLKSSFISLEIVLGMTKDFEANAIIYRKVADTLATSVYEQILWAIDKLGMNEDWKCTKSPFVCEYKPFGTKIIFRGLDKAKKSKSIKFSHGYAKFLWFEEFDEYNGPEEIRSVQQSVLRGGEKFFIFKSMNPPKSKANWANEQIAEDKLRDDVYVSETNYLQAPVEWLGQQFIDDAGWLKEINTQAYNHEYLGEMTGTGADVFDNIVSRRISDEEISHFSNIYMGVDWGWFPDPYRWVKMNFDANRRILTIFDEISCNKKTNSETFKILKEEKGVTKNDLITCDSAEQKSIGDYKVWGFLARGAEKGPHSVATGIHWLQQLNAIEIDPLRCPKTHKEFTKYELDLDKDGNPIDDAFPDKDNHSIDAVRYAMERVSTRRGQ